MMNMVHDDEKWFNLMAVRGRINIVLDENIEKYSTKTVITRLTSSI